jgi:hypothetical protein
VNVCLRPVARVNRRHFFYQLYRASGFTAFDQRIDGETGKNPVVVKGGEAFAPREDPQAELARFSNLAHDEMTIHLRD